MTFGKGLIHYYGEQFGHKTNTKEAVKAVKTVPGWQWSIFRAIKLTSAPAYTTLTVPRAALCENETTCPHFKLIDFLNKLLASH